MKYIVIVYFKDDGMSSYGPFDTEDEAEDERIAQESEWEDDPDFDRIEIEETDDCITELHVE